MVAFIGGFHCTLLTGGSSRSLSAGSSARAGGSSSALAGASGSSSAGGSSRSLNAGGSPGRSSVYHHRDPLEIITCTRCVIKCYVYLQLESFSLLLWLEREGHSQLEGWILSHGLLH